MESVTVHVLRRNFTEAYETCRQYVACGIDACYIKRQKRYPRMLQVARFCLSTASSLGMIQCVDQCRCLSNSQWSCAACCMRRKRMNKKLPLLLTLSLRNYGTIKLPNIKILVLITLI